MITKIKPIKSAPNNTIEQAAFKNDSIRNKTLFKGLVLKTTPAEDKSDNIKKKKKDNSKKKN